MKVLVADLDIMDEQFSRDLESSFPDVDFIYACLLYYLKVISTIPISTTWVFIGLLGGRELAINLRLNKANVSLSIKMILKDALYAGIGLLISLIIAFSVNENMRNELFN